ncbi:hypothetical protein A8924_1747 [Saccharopolyspora erythraea NRRL 2338]|uniref:Uncharacterized protein n=2 Tax=Saccharopolyspora erythraea TaxID=1836 RepID=A4F9E8_SACEN|nr:hypothetical protein [Saccharopolyspora erythraea]EQD87379.1 hypothetical protein N599_04975 [Saccharopolyspora erythraea D]PFG94461.1 hypothetical protein A8924_1747 [Saccharopolyspora erythraea NRRL 2338]QRK91217.1 hypothetical protein JQX30_07305 [Saccharopolyspora erythraea]CAM00673.1 hypothetical protein SACE_1350 [Saccharopolyspora erythraea NRRL 2338]
MASQATAPLTVLAGVGGTVVGTLLLLFGQSAMQPWLLGGPGSTCPEPDCALGVGVSLIIGAVVAVLVSVVVSVLVAVRHRDAPPREGVLRGLRVCLWLLLAYLVESIVLWVVV